MEDSGFDSGDRVANFMLNYNNNNNNNNNNKNHNNSSDNLGCESSTSNEDILNINHVIKDNIDDVAFRNPSLINNNTNVTTTSSSRVLIDHQKTHHHLNEHNKKLSNINTCKSLHRKLEEKVNRAKKNFLHNEKFNQLENDIEAKKSLPNLISIERLPFPRSNVESHKPLVEYKSDNSDDDEVTTFFPIHKKPKKTRLRKQQKHKDVDTFSIQEMTIVESDSEGNYGDKSSDDDDCDSQLNLELPSRTNESFLIKLKKMFCCTQSNQNMF